MALRVADGYLHRVKTILIPVDHAMSVGNTLSSIANIVNYLSQEQKVDCLLLSTDIHANKDGLEKVLSRAHCPALVIPAIGKEQ